MKIAFITSGTVKSSISYRALAFAKELHKMGHDMYIIAPRFDKYSHFKDEKIVTMDGIKIIRPWQIPYIPFMLGLIPYIISSVILLIKLKPQIVHIYKANPITFGGLAIKLLKNTPVILDLDDLDSEVMKIEKNPPFVVWLVKASERLLLTFSDAITVGSKYLKNYYFSYYNKKKIFRIPNGAEFTTKYKMHSGKKNSRRILFLGNINRRTILEPLFYALQQINLEDIVFEAVIIGDGMYLSFFKKLVKKMGLEKKVTFLGFVPRSRLGKYVKAGDIGYCYMPNVPTVRACSSMKVFQYMQLGAVPLVSNVGDLPAYTFSGKGGFIVQSDNNDKLTKALKKALSDTKSRIKKIAFAKKHAKEYYRWSILATEVEGVYKKLYE